MKIDGKGSILIGASITLTKDCKVWNMRFVNCDIDDLEAMYPWAENCRFESCKLRSQWETEQKFKNK